MTLEGRSPRLISARDAGDLRLRQYQPGAVESSLEREAQHNIEMMWLTGRLAPDFKTIADFRKDNGPPIPAAYRQFIALCRRLELLTNAIAAIHGSKLKAVNTRDITSPAPPSALDGAGRGQHRASYVSA